MELKHFTYRNDENIVSLYKMKNNKFVLLTPESIPFRNDPYYYDLKVLDEIVFEMSLIPVNKSKMILMEIPNLEILFNNYLFQDFKKMLNLSFTEDEEKMIQEFEKMKKPITLNKNNSVKIKFKDTMIKIGSFFSHDLIHNLSDSKKIEMSKQIFDSLDKIESNLVIAIKSFDHQIIEKLKIHSEGYLQRSINDKMRSGLQRNSDILERNKVFREITEKRELPEYEYTIDEVNLFRQEMFDILVKNKKNYFSETKIYNNNSICNSDHFLQEFGFMIYDATPHEIDHSNNLYISRKGPEKPLPRIKSDEFDLPLILDYSNFIMINNIKCCKIKSFVKRENCLNLNIFKTAAKISIKNIVPFDEHKDKVKKITEDDQNIFKDFDKKFKRKLLSPSTIIDGLKPDLLILEKKEENNESFCIFCNRMYTTSRDEHENHCMFNDNLFSIEQEEE